MAYTVIYDGECRVCRASIEGLERWDHERVLEMVPFQAPGARERFAWIDSAAFESEIQLVAPDGETWSGAAAVEQLLEILPRGGMLGWLFKLPFGRPIADRLYRSFARRRLHFGRVACDDHCAVQPPSSTRM